MGTQRKNGTATLTTASLPTVSAPQEPTIDPVPASEAPTDLVALLVWCERHEAKIAWFNRKGSGLKRVRCTLEGGISYEGETLAEVVRLCDERIQRRSERCRVSWIA